MFARAHGRIDAALLLGKVTLVVVTLFASHQGQEWSLVLYMLAMGTGLMYAHVRFLPYYQRTASCVTLAMGGSVVWTTGCLALNMLLGDPRMERGQAVGATGGFSWLADVRSDMSLMYLLTVPLAFVACWAAAALRLEAVMRYVRAGSQGQPVPGRPVLRGWSRWYVCMVCCHQVVVARADK